MALEEKVEEDRETKTRKEQNARRQKSAKKKLRKKVKLKWNQRVKRGEVSNAELEAEVKCNSKKASLTSHNQWAKVLKKKKKKESCKQKAKRYWQLKDNQAVKSQCKKAKTNESDKDLKRQTAN